MNGHILNMDKTIHEKVQTLLPWFVIDKLSGEELDLVNRHLHVCEECQSDFTWQCKLQATPPDDEVELNVDSAYAKLLPRLLPAHAKAQRRTLLSMLGKFWQGNPGWMQLAMAVQFSVIVGLTFLLASPDGNIAAYRALGANMNTTGNMVVVFSPTTSEQELRRILHNTGARIVDGPTVTDAYLLNVPEERLDGSLRELRADRAVVLAESLRSGGKK
jgi:hypothetical protein